VFCTTGGLWAGEEGEVKGEGGEGRGGERQVFCGVAVPGDQSGATACVLCSLHVYG